MTEVGTDAFSRIISPYLHQDWPDEFENTSQALTAMIANESHEEFDNVCNEISHLLSSNLTEHDLEVVMRDQAGCYFAPASEDHTYRSWLAEVLTRLTC